MCISIKAVNHKIIFTCNEYVKFNIILNELTELLDSEMFANISYYPKAFFDFGCRKMDYNDFLQLVYLLLKKKKVIYSGSNYRLQKVKTMVMIDREIFAGQCQKEYQKCIFTKKIHHDARLEIYNDVYFLNQVSGTIIIKNKDVKIYGHHFDNANIYFSQETRQDITYFGKVEIYYRHNDMCLNKGAF